MEKETTQTAYVWPDKVAIKVEIPGEGYWDMDSFGKAGFIALTEVGPINEGGRDLSGLLTVYEKRNPIRIKPEPYKSHIADFLYIVVMSHVPGSNSSLWLIRSELDFITFLVYISPFVSMMLNCEKETSRLNKIMERS